MYVLYIGWTHHPLLLCVVGLFSGPAIGRQHCHGPEAKVYWPAGHSDGDGGPPPWLPQLARQRHQRGLLQE